MRKTKYIFNIGLNNNPLAKDDQWVKHLVRFTTKGDGFAFFKFTEHTGEWNGKPEKTVIAEGYNSLEFNNAVRIARELCVTMEQDAIAVYNTETEQGRLVYNPKFKGERKEFDEDYFLI